MKQILKKAFTQNIGLKLLAVVFSFALWLVVVIALSAHDLHLINVN